MILCTEPFDARLSVVVLIQKDEIWSVQRWVESKFNCRVQCQRDYRANGKGKAVCEKGKVKQLVYQKLKRRTEKKAADE